MLRTWISNCTLSTKERVDKTLSFIYTYLINRPQAVFSYLTWPWPSPNIILMNLVNYVKNSFAELQKVQWLTKKQTINYTIAVFAMSVGVAVFFVLLDRFLSSGLDKIIK